MPRGLQKRALWVCFSGATFAFQGNTLNTTHCYLPQEETNCWHVSAAGQGRAEEGQPTRPRQQREAQRCAAKSSSGVAALDGVSPLPPPPRGSGSLATSPLWIRPMGATLFTQGEAAKNAVTTELAAHGLVLLVLPLSQRSPLTAMNGSSITPPLPSHFLFKPLCLVPAPGS